MWQYVLTTQGQTVVSLTAATRRKKMASCSGQSGWMNCWAGRSDPALHPDCAPQPHKASAPAGQESSCLSVPHCIWLDLYSVLHKAYCKVGFPASSVGKESACNVGDPSSIPGSGRSAGEGISYPLQLFLGFPDGSDCKESACNAKIWVRSLDWEDPLEKGAAPYSSILAWRIPWTV